MLYNMRVSKWSQTTNNPPAIFTPISYYGNISFVQSAGVLAPSNTNAFNIQNKTPVNYPDLSFSIQRDLGFSTLLDVSYSGNLGRHLTQTSNTNTVPYGARCLLQNQDPTNGKPLPDNFFRPYPGYNTITLTDNAYTSNYHALLVSVKRRFTNGFQLGLAYTYSKFMDYTNIPYYRPLRQWSYGLDGSDQTRSFLMNYTYEIPSITKLISNPVLHFIADDWQLSGITQFVSGQPQAISFSTTERRIKPAVVTDNE